MDSKVKRLSNANLKQEGPRSEEDLPLEEIDAALNSGRCLLYISMGTVANTDDKWNSQFGKLAASNGLAERTGKELEENWHSASGATHFRGRLLLVGRPPPPTTREHHREAVPHAAFSSPAAADVPVRGATQVRRASATPDDALAALVWRGAGAATRDGHDDLLRSG